MGRFINADSQFDGNAGIAGYNLFAYCANSPVIYRDASGFALDTIIDIGSAVGSLVVLIANPTLENLGYLVWDVGAAVIPFVPGSDIGLMASMLTLLLMG